MFGGWGAPGWLSRLNAWLRLTVRGFEPHVGLYADRSEPGACFGFCVSLCLSAPPLFPPCLSFFLSLSLSVSLKNE